MISSPVKANFRALVHTIFAQINHLSDGMKIGLTDKVEKHSDALGRDAVFSRQSRIKRLPRYLCIQVKNRRCFLARAVGTCFTRFSFCWCG